ncbi:MAG: M48 family metallopeptidase [Bacteroidota bacterium]|nr:M48 family metallopeptidase [Bacteroidota bacterium]
MKKDCKGTAFEILYKYFLMIELKELLICIFVDITSLYRSNMSPQTLLLIILCIVTFEFIFELFLEIINLQNQKAELPSELADVYDNDQYVKSLQYQNATTKFGFITTGFTFLLSFIMLATGGFGWVNNWLMQWIQQPMLLSLSFFGIMFIVSDVLSIPFQWYSTFVIEEKYGFNKMTPSLFIQDKLKGYALSAILGAIIIGTLLFLIQWLGNSFWIIFWVFISAFMVFMNMFYTSLIVPIFNKLQPLEEGDLKNAIVTYCQKVQFPLSNLFVIDGSKRSSKANAYFSGLGKQKKVVLYDTLIKDHSIDELVAVLAHEVGHFKKKHIIWSIVFSVIQVGIMLYVLSLFVFNEKLSFALGANQNYIHLNLIAFGLLYSPLSTISGLLMTIISRKNEYEADDYAKNTFGFEPLILALKKLSSNNLSNITPHPLYVFFHYSHPPLLARIRNLSK